MLTKTIGIKECRKCHIQKDVINFHKNKNTKDGLQNECISCHKVRKMHVNLTPERRALLCQRTKDYFSTPRGKSSKRKSSLKIYGMSPEEYSLLLKTQDNKCAICKSTTPGMGKSNFCVDHNHITGKIRGLLCSFCNAGLGYFKVDSNSNILTEALDYLKEVK